MKKLLRKWLGIEKIEVDAIKTQTVLCKAIDETFDLKKTDRSIQGKMMQILMRDVDKLFGMEVKVDTKLKNKEWELRNG